MQSSAANHYLPDEFNENFFYSDSHLDKDLLFQAEAIMNDQEDDDDYLRGTSPGRINGCGRCSDGTVSRLLDRHGQWAGRFGNPRESTDVESSSFLSNQYALFDHE